MSISETRKAQQYASVAEVAAAQAKLYADKLETAPDYAEQAAASAAAAALSAQAAISAESVVNNLANSASESATSAAASAAEAGNAAAAAVGQCIRVPDGESISVLPAASERETSFVVFGNDGDVGVLPQSSVAVLDSDGKIPASMIPTIAISQTYVVSSQAEMLALNANIGDVAKRTDLGYSFILGQEPASSLSNWIQLNDDVLTQLAQSNGASLIGYNSETLEDVADRVDLKLNGQYTFLAGGTLQSQKDFIYDQTTYSWYFWSGTFPKTIPSSSSVDSTGGLGQGKWKRVGDDGSLLTVNGGALRTFQSVSDMKAYAVESGRVYETSGYYTPGDGGGAFYVASSTGATPDGYGDHVASNGVFLRLISQPTDLNHGAIIGASFVAQTAWHNRNAYQAGVDNPRFSKFCFIAQGITASLSTVHVSRDNYEIVIEKGCTLQNYYNDPSIPESLTPQCGAFINVAHFFNPQAGDFIPYANGDTRVNAPVYNTKIRLEGEVSTMYRSVHANQYNNNAIAFLKAVNCEVIGSGGIGESDHRGINFDGIATNAPNGSDNRGGAVNCRMKVGYINNCVNNPAMMQGDIFTRNTCSIKIGSVGPMRSGGYNNPIVVNVAGLTTDHIISIGGFIRGGGVTPGFVVARSCSSVKLRAGTVNGVKQILYSDGSYDNDIKVDGIYNTPIVFYRAGTTAGVLRTVRVSGIKTTDGQLTTVYADANQTTPFLLLEIVNNSFASVGAGFTYYSGRASSSLPSIEDIRNNIPPATGDGGATLNIYPTKTLLLSGVTDGLTTATVNFKDTNWNYTKLTVCCRNGSARGEVTIDLRARAVTGNDITFNAGPYPVLTQMALGGGTITLTPTPPAVLSYAMLHN
ncbi:TPA: hypothetical protein ACYU26_002185 [Enterobacter ludwigii]